MDEYSGKRAIDGVVVPKKGMTHLFRDTANTRDRNGQLCSRLGCSGRVKSPKGAQIGTSDKGKSLKPLIQSPSSRKQAIGSSSRTLPGSSNHGKSLTEPRKTLSSRFETVSSETSSLQDEPEISELNPPPGKIQRGLQAEAENTRSNSVIPTEVGSSSVASNTRCRRNLHQKSGFNGQEIKSTGPVTRTGTSRYGLRNLKCNSISDVIPAGSSSSDSTTNRRKDLMKRRNCEGESSSTGRGKKMSGFSLDGQNSGSRNGISISESRRSRNIPPQRDTNVASVRTRRSFSGHSRGRLSSEANENPAPPIGAPVNLSPSPFSSDLNAHDLLQQASVEVPLTHPRSYSRSGGSNSSEQLFGMMPSSPSEYGITHSIINRESFRRYHMDGIAEVIFYVKYRRSFVSAYNPRTDLFMYV